MESLGPLKKREPITLKNIDVDHLAVIDRALIYQQSKTNEIVELLIKEFEIKDEFEVVGARYGHVIRERCNYYYPSVITFEMVRTYCRLSGDSDPILQLDRLSLKKIVDCSDILDVLSTSRILRWISREMIHDFVLEMAGRYRRVTCSERLH